MGWGKGERPAEEEGGGVRRGWCVVAMETPSPSLIIIWGKMARGLLPRVTPPPPFLPTPLSLPSLPLPSRWQLRFFFCFHLAFFLRTPPRSSLPLPPHPPPALTSSADCFFYAFYFSSGFTSPSHRTAAPTLPASGILCLHLTGATV